MLDQSFSLQELKRLLTKEDVARYRLWRPRDDHNLVISKISKNINSSNFTFPEFHEKCIKGKTIFSAPNIETILAIRKINYNIKAIYKVKQTSRDIIVNQVKSLLYEGCKFSVIRLDISSCYESIDRSEVLGWLERDSIVSYKTRMLLRQLFGIPQFSNGYGVPRGLALSATFSELFLRKLDRRIRSLDHVYFYSRYVDDMIIFSHKSPESAMHQLEVIIKEIGLTFNEDKTTKIECVSGKDKQNNTFKNFNFLGYNFKCREFLQVDNSWRDVNINISDSKIKKIKSRIINSFIDFSKNTDFFLLEKRLRFLCGNYPLKKDHNRNLFGGIYYNYKHLTEVDELKNLNIFLRKIIFARKGSLGKRLAGVLNDDQRKKLLRMNFLTGFNDRWSHQIKRDEISELRRCWRYEKN